MIEAVRFVPFDPRAEGEIVRWVAGDRWPFHGVEAPTAQNVSAWVREGRFHSDESRSFWIVREGDGERVGLVTVEDLGDPTPIFDLRVARPYRGRGIGRQAVTWLARYVFTEFGKHRVEGHTRHDNVAMRRVFEACGWVQEAYYRRAWRDSASNWHDAVAYALLRDDWESGRTTPIGDRLF